jgi:LacI family transcriptional regulator
MSAVTLTDVARHAGVSLATASRVLNGSARTPAESIAERVRASAEELGYVANAQAQGLARSVTGSIGLVVHDITDPYFSTITRGAQRYAGVRRTQVLLAAAERNEAAELAAVAALVSYRMDAIILAGSRRKEPDAQLARELDRYINNGGRVVTLGRSSIPGSWSLQVGNRSGARLLVRALIERGCTRFAILAGPLDLETSSQRVLGYRDALTEAGLEPLAEVPADFNRRGGIVSALACWEQVKGERGDGPLCLLVVNDVMAMGAIAGLRSAGLSVPRDVQVAGFDDIPTLQDFSPALTTFRLPLELIGEKAVELALGPAPSGPTVIEGDVALRESAGAVLLDG